MPVRVQEKPKFKIKIKRNDQVVVIAGQGHGQEGPRATCARGDGIAC